MIGISTGYPIESKTLSLIVMYGDGFIAKLAVLYSRTLNSNGSILENCCGSVLSYVSLKLIE